MQNKFLELAEKRRSIYNLGDKKVLSEEKITEIVKEAVKHCPTAFNSQSGRVVVLFGENHQKLWNICVECLRKIVPEAAFANTEKKLASFAAGYGTILYFIDDETTQKLQADFPTYKDNFPVWAEQANGMLQYMIWTALAEENVGASLQHYNPLIDDEVRKNWDIPASWRLIAQMPLGSIEAPAGEKTFLPIDMRVKVY